MTQTRTFDQQRNDIWAYALLKEFNNANGDIWNYLRRQLVAPNIVITDQIGKSTYGRWIPSMRIIEMNVNFMKRWGWKDVIQTFRHEIAHMVVDEIYKVADCDPHGEHFKLACGVLGILPDQYHPQNVEESAQSQVVDRVVKLLNKGNCETVTKEEADAFLAKAYEIMRREQISEHDLNSKSKNADTFVSRPVGDIYKKIFPKYLYAITGMLVEHYGVKCITMYHRGRRYLEIFGTVDNCDVAQYIYESLLRSGEEAWTKFYWENHKRRGTPAFERISKAGFLYGLFVGYAEQIEKNAKAFNSDIERLNGATIRAVVLANDKKLNEKYHEAHPNLRSGSAYSIPTRGYSAGKTVGNTLRLAPAVRGASVSRQLQLA